MHDDDPTPKHTIEIELRGGPQHGYVIRGYEVPTDDGLPDLVEVRDDLTVLACSIPATIFELPLGAYVPTDKHCENGHVVYEWTMPDTRRN